MSSKFLLEKIIVCHSELSVERSECSYLAGYLPMQQLRPRRPPGNCHVHSGRVSRTTGAQQPIEFGVLCEIEPSHQVGNIFVIYQRRGQRLVRLLFWCLFYGVCAGALCGFSQHDGLIPINKNLWSANRLIVAWHPKWLVHNASLPI